LNAKPNEVSDIADPLIVLPDDSAKPLIDALADLARAFIGVRSSTRSTCPLAAWTNAANWPSKPPRPRCKWGAAW